MLYFHNDYHDCCHEAVMQKMLSSSRECYPGYSTDECCRRAAMQICDLCGREDVAVHFLVGGTQTNMTVIAAALRPHQAVIGAQTAHIQVHETGAIEATGHKILALPTENGKLTAAQVEEVVRLHRSDADAEHTAQPKMVYISNSTEVGTVYNKAELTALSQACHQLGLYLFMDGARLGYALTSAESDLTMADIAELCDVFYIGGTKVGAMFGEAVVITNPAIAEDFRYLIKQRGGMLAKGWLLGLQFEALLQDGLYLEISRHANSMAEKIRMTLREIGVPVRYENGSNQIFPVLSDDFLEELSKDFTFSEMGRVDAHHRMVRFCTSWATREADVNALCERMRKINQNSQ